MMEQEEIEQRIIESMKKLKPVFDEMKKDPAYKKIEKELEGEI